ncbi:hypothetical protein EYC80_002081 [Monilinia laxa]|uniref:Uncharacterized protein n=1 Tax=Monilinia laxa TaxID=61186 RepID=A0A5N6K2W2_MONLA|nr:hypothetical protein EYC80_002081 [Monilinia laxa]
MTTFMENNKETPQDTYQYYPTQLPNSSPDSVVSDINAGSDLTGSSDGTHLKLLRAFLAAPLRFSSWRTMCRGMKIMKMMMAVMTRRAAMTVLMACAL